MAFVLGFVSPAKQQAPVCQQPLADATTQPRADALEVAQQVRPADLAPGKGQVVVARIPVTDRDKARVFAQDQFGRPLSTRRVDAKPRPPVTDQYPHPQRVAVALVSGLIGVAHGSVLQLVVQLCHGLLQRLADQPVGL